MNRKLATVLILALAASSAAFAQISLGATGAIYANNRMSIGEITERFKSGQGIFYGPFAEFGFGGMALGASLNVSYYNEMIGSMPVRMKDFDVDLYAQAHPFGYRAFIDPFLELGVGRMARDYASREDDPDLSNPLLASDYWQAGGGVGINLGSLGLFVKTLYMMPVGTPRTSSGYDLEAYPLKNLKVFVGGKVMLFR